jgi:hypothetical protein
MPAKVGPFFSFTVDDFSEDAGDQRLKAFFVKRSEGRLIGWTL